MIFDQGKPQPFFAALLQGAIYTRQNDSARLISSYMASNKHGKITIEPWWNCVGRGDTVFISVGKAANESATAKYLAQPYG